MVPRTPTSAGSSCAHQRGGNTQSSALSDGRNGYARRRTQCVSDMENMLHSVQNKARAHNSMFYLHRPQDYLPVLANSTTTPTSFQR